MKSPNNKIETNNKSECSGANVLLISSNKSYEEESIDFGKESANDETESMDSDQKLRVVRKWTPEEVYYYNHVVYFS